MSIIALNPYCKIDLNKRVICRHGLSYSLSEIDYRIVELLVKNLGETVCTQDLLSYAWSDFDQHKKEIVKVHILGIRKKIETDFRNPQHVITIFKVGYHLIKK
nr:winged helix-turn-helix transcriptional regulator [Bacilli bacterium]